MNNIDVIKVSLRNLNEEAEKYFNNSFDIRIVRSFFDIVTGLEYIITKHFVCTEVLGDFKKGLPRYKHLDFGLIEKTFLEKISEYPIVGFRSGVSFQDYKGYNEEMGFVYRSKKREYVRNEITKQIIEINALAKETLRKLITSNLKA